MTLLKQALAVLGTVVVIALVVAIISPKTVRAVAATLVQIEPGTTTHVGQNETQLVSLFCDYGAAYCVNISSQGIYGGTTPYVVPSGYTLVVTDWEYASIAGVGTSGHLANNGLQITNGDGSFGTIVYSTVVADAAGEIAAHERYQTGIRIGSGLMPVDALASEDKAEANIQGYLVPN